MRSRISGLLTQLTALRHGGRRRRGLVVLGLVASAVALSAFVLSNALAGGVQEEGVFQLDGNALNTQNSTPAMLPATEDADNLCAAHLKVDNTNPADEFCHPTSSELTRLSGLTTASERSAFVTDGSGAFASGANDDQWTGGSKDDQNISDWRYKQAASSNDKSDIENAFAAVYTTSNNHKVIYFGGDRISNSGSENTAFWFLQKSVGEKPNTSSGCTISSGCPFTGEHTAAEPGPDNCLTPQGQTKGINMTTGGSCTESDNGVGKPSTDAGGDVLIVSAFSVGGTQPTTTAYEWVGVGKAPKSRCVTSKCSVIEITEPKPGCEPEGLGKEDPVCAITNQNIKYAKCPSSEPCVAGNAEPITSPWIYTEKSSDTATSGASACTVAPNKMCPGVYFEGGLDLTALGLGEECTATFTMDTRSSASVDASLQDLALGELGKCESKIETTAGTIAGPAPTKIEKGEVSSGKDSANVTVKGISTWSGTVDFYVCGPIATGACNSGGVKANGTTENVGVKVSNAEATVESGSAKLTSAGRYCWYATFTPDTATKSKGVEPAEDDGSGHTPNPECFEVAPVTPKLTTSAKCSATPCVLGSTLEDEASLTGTATNPDPSKPGPNSTYPTINGGTKPADKSITWTVYGPATGGAAQCTTAITGAPTPSSKTVSGDGTYGPVSYETKSSDKVGAYEFAAKYPGEGPNTLAAADVTCDTTGANGEQVTVIGSASTSSQQRWLPNDRVVLASTPGTTLSGTLTVTLYSGTFAINPTTHVCTPESTATAVPGQQYTFKPSGAASGSAFNTNNQTFVVGTNSDGTAAGADGNYFWLIHYTDNSLTSPPDRCEQTSLTLTDSPPGS